MKISRKALGLYEKAIDFLNKDQLYKSLDFLLESLKIEPNFADAISYLADVHRRLDYKIKTKDEVFNLLEKAVEIDPNSAIVMKNLGIGYAVIKNDLDKAVECYNKAIKIDPKINVYLNLGNIYSRRKEYDKAIKYYTKIQSGEPQYFGALRNLGIVYFDKKMYEKAIYFYEKTLGLKPSVVVDWMNLIFCYIFKKDFSKIFETIDRARLAFPHDLTLENFLEVVEKEYGVRHKLYNLTKKITKKIKEETTDMNGSIELLKESYAILRKEIPIDTLIAIEEKNSNNFFSKNYHRFREIQAQMQNYAIKHPDYPDLKRFTELDLTTNLREFLHSFKNTLFNYPSKELYNEISNLLGEVDVILIIANKLNIIPFSVQKTIKKSIINLGMKFNRLKIVEIAEKCREAEDSIVLTTLDMIENKEIHAEYFSSTRTLAFDQRTNIDECDSLLKKFDEWKLQFCKNCGKKILDNKQQICEYCGENL